MGVVKHYIGGVRDGDEWVCETAPATHYVDPGDPNLTGPIPEEFHDRVRCADGLAAVYRCIGTPANHEREDELLEALLVGRIEGFGAGKILGRPQNAHVPGQLGVGRAKEGQRLILVLADEEHRRPPARGLVARQRRRPAGDQGVVTAKRARPTAREAQSPSPDGNPPIRRTRRHTTGPPRRSALRSDAEGGRGRTRARPG